MDTCFPKIGHKLCTHQSKCIGTKYSSITEEEVPRGTCVFGLSQNPTVLDLEIKDLLGQRIGHSMNTVI